MPAANSCAEHCAQIRFCSNWIAGTFSIRCLLSAFLGPIVCEGILSDLHFGLCRMRTSHFCAWTDLNVGKLFHRRELAEAWQAPLLRRFYLTLSH